MGRPTDYNTEMLEKAKTYLDSWQDNGANIPQIASLALFLGVSKSTLYLWAEDHKPFSDVLDEVRAAQEQMLIRNGLSGDFNSTITKLVLTKHGYHDKQDLEHTGANGKPLEISVKWGDS